MHCGHLTSALIGRGRGTGRDEHGDESGTRPSTQLQLYPRYVALGFCNGFTVYGFTALLCGLKQQSKPYGFTEGVRGTAS